MTTTIVTTDLCDPGEPTGLPTGLPTGTYGNPRAYPRACPQQPTGVPTGTHGLIHGLAHSNPRAYPLEPTGLPTGTHGTHETHGYLVHSNKIYKTHVYNYNRMLACFEICSSHILIKCLLHVVYIIP